jgi:putative PIN family toxin of toxin-antitoxin system
MRVIIDPSVLIRAMLPSTNPARAVDLIVGAALAGAFVLLLPPELRAELFARAEHRPYLAQRISPERRRAFAALLDGVGTPLPPFPRPFPARTRDPDDDYLLAYALRDRADFLVTGDRDLLELAPTIAPPRIVDPGAFVRELRARGLDQ